MTLPARALAAVTAVSTAGAVLIGAAVPAHAEEATPAQVSLRPVTAGTPVTGPFAVAADVTMNVSTVSWSSLPTAAKSGALVYARVYAKPYEKGASVRVRARLKGTGTWRTLGSAAASSAGHAKPTMRLYTRGTWQVRVVRVATSQRAAGYSSVKRISVR